MELSDRDRMLLAFANLASHGIAARPAMASDAAGLAAKLGARHPGGLRSYVFWHRDDDASFDPTGTLTDALTLHCSSEESLTAARAACRQVGVDVVRTGRPHTLTITHTRPAADRPAHSPDAGRAPTARSDRRCAAAARAPTATTRRTSKPALPRSRS
jgi:hypothetical protein